MKSRQKQHTEQHPAVRLLLATASAALLALCWRSDSPPWLPFVFLAPFALSLRGVRPLQGLLLGWTAGALFWLVSTWWVYNAFVDMLGWPWPGAALATGLFFLFQGLPYAGLGLACGFMNRRGRTPGALFCAGLLTLLVFLRPAVCPGSAALTLYSWPLPIQAADLGGVHLVLFILLLANWLAAEALVNIARPRAALGRLAALAGLLGLVCGYGAWRLDVFQQLPAAAPESDFITIQAIQPNIPVKGYQGLESSGPHAGVVGAMAKATELAAAKLPPADLVLWPEVPKDVDCDCTSLRRDGAARASGAAGGPVLLACVELDHGDNPVVQQEMQDADGRGAAMSTRKIDAMYNALWLVDENECRMAYHKVELVPFGERTPFQESWPWLKRTVGRTLEYTPGPGPRLVELPGGRRVQPLICFESGFPELARQGAALGAEAFVNVSDDAWFGSAKAAELHLAMARFRAVEQRRPLVRCTNNGFGAHVRATGEIVPGTLTPMDVRTARSARLFCPGERTVYARVGDAWLWILFVACAAWALVRAKASGRGGGRF
ncbi:MAG: apolipoprotein N-acyltransferase [Desulfovibrionaceae bacterium]